MVDYALVIKRLESFLKDTHYNLVETLADRVMDLILEDRRVLKIKLKSLFSKKVVAAFAVAIFYSYVLGLDGRPTL